jgi:molybdopterin-guanine dinucleotide biosynthesis protein B
MTRAAAIVGLSGSGKTTLIESLIRVYVSRGLRVAAIKHTHHPVNDRDYDPNKGDTARFLRAGARPVILAGDGEAVVFPEGERVRYDSPRDLIKESGWRVAGGWGEAHEPPATSHQPLIVLIEGFKHFEGWPRIELVRGEWQSADEVAATLDRIWGFP